MRQYLWLAYRRAPLFSLNILQVKTNTAAEDRHSQEEVAVLYS